MFALRRYLSGHRGLLCPVYKIQDTRDLGQGLHRSCRLLGIFGEVEIDTEGPSLEVLSDVIPEKPEVGAEGGE